ncbi:histidinol-phosphate transaminase [Aureibacillus halotolerans]|uniref:Histidinol-phosphate aminotransferase n=1 Tax=Aureibacillus halotolerans TaxID=1508390 RepID=A0A4R6U5M0_9BACI|nr:histidinol-phosphate transaminase [Aureibacillus halotolerans]TDQ41521.1 histidinol-phosphate aminotransferase [Aureibacillus halotolerans]
MKIKQQLQGMASYKPGMTPENVRASLGLEKIVKLSSNENPKGPSPKAIEAATKSLQQIFLYPDGYGLQLKQCLAAMHGMPVEQFILGNGSDEIILILCRALLQAGDNTVMPTPSFPQYRHNAMIEGAECREVELIQGAHALDAMAEAIDDSTKIVWICNPNNPTGVHISSEAFVAFMEKVPPHVLVVSDEAYIEYVTADDFPDSLALISKYPNLMVLRTFSKAYGLAGLRVGYGVASEALISQIDPAREPFNTSIPAHSAAIAALSDVNYLAETRNENAAIKATFRTFCESLGLTVYPSETNFVLVDFHAPADEVYNGLLHEGFIVRSGAALGFPSAVRITIGSEEDMAELSAAISRVLPTLTVGEEK